MGYGLRWIHLRRGGPFSPLGIRISLISTSGFRTPPTVRSGAFRSIRHPYAYRAYIKRMSSLFVLRYTVDAKSHNEYKNVTHKMIASPCIFKSECITLSASHWASVVMINALWIELVRLVRFIFQSINWDLQRTAMIWHILVHVLC